MKLEVDITGYEMFTITPRSPEILPILEIYKNHFMGSGCRPRYEHQLKLWNYIAKCAHLRGVKCEKVAGVPAANKGGNLPFSTFNMILEDGTRL